MQLSRCRWVTDDPLYRAYHDDEWGKPIYDARLLFEFLILEGAQAGLSWWTILKKREHYRLVFDQFDAEKIACYDAQKIAALLQDPGIVRNRLKINAAIGNAQAFLKLQQTICFSDFIWSFVEAKPIQNRWQDSSQVPATSVVSDLMAAALKVRGFKFVGSTICYAFMQAVGMVNDHIEDCFLCDIKTPFVVNNLIV